MYYYSVKIGKIRLSIRYKTIVEFLICFRLFFCGCILPISDYAFYVLLFFLTNIIMKIVYLVALILLIVGWLNWGLVGFFNFDLVATIFGDMASLSRVVYGLVGLSAIFVAYSHFTKCDCKK